MAVQNLVIGSMDINLAEFDNQVVWFDGHGTAFFRNYFKFYGPVWVPFTHTLEEIYADEIVIIKNPNLLQMRGVELIKVSGSDFVRLAFHANFHCVLGNQLVP